MRQIRKADFRIFDNREADLKPNVYIEAGIAYVLGKPFIMADYRGNRLQPPQRFGTLIELNIEITKS